MARRVCTAAARPRSNYNSTWRANIMSDIGGPNSKVVQHIQMNKSMKFCVDLTYGEGFMAL
uniref:Uncharacterized protein n=1 Tax=Anguilla anguilla TaxID=7936 RepID=A0A0E9RUN3_ANGAN